MRPMSGSQSLLVALSKLVVATHIQAVPVACHEAGTKLNMFCHVLSVLPTVSMIFKAWLMPV